MLTKKVSRLIAPDCGASAMLRNAAFMLALAAAQPVFAADPYNSDHPGGSDHPLLSRYQGSMLYMYGEDSLGTTQIVVDEKRKAVLRPLEGKIASRLYWGPKGRSPLEVFRNYRHALESAGFQTVYACETPKCETDRVQSMIYELPRTAAWKKGDPMIDSTFNSANQPAFHYISARRDGPSGATHVMVALVGGSNDAPVLGRVRQFITIVEPAKAELGKVTVDAKAIQSSLQRDGRIADSFQRDETEMPLTGY